MYHFTNKLFSPAWVSSYYQILAPGGDLSPYWKKKKKQRKKYLMFSYYYYYYFLSKSPTNYTKTPNKFTLRVGLCELEYNL